MTLPRDAYLHALTTGSLINPDTRQLMRLLPHLSLHQIQQLPWPNDDGDTTIALPPVQIHGVCQVAHLSQLDGIRSITVLGKALPQGCPGYEQLPFHREALAHAAECWGDSLRPGTWDKVVCLRVYNPMMRDVAGTPRLVTSLWCALRQSSSGLLALPGATWGQFNEAIDLITDNPYAGAELAAGREVRVFGNCAVCGAGLGPTSCYDCHQEFAAINGVTPWDMPLPPVAVAVIRRSGYKFEREPERLHHS